MTQAAGESAVHLIINPTSANGKLGRLWPRLLQDLEAAHLQFTFEFTTAPGHATELARAARQQNVGTVVAVGGDGTVHEVVNGLVDDEPLADSRDRTPPVLGVIPFGTGTDFVRTVGIPRRPDRAIRCLLEGKQQLIDLGHITYHHKGQIVQRYFANVVGMGFDAACAERVNRSSKALGGTIPFLTSVLVEIFTYQNKEVSVRFDGQQYSGNVNAVVVCNGRYFGGGMEVGPHARPDDGLLDLVIIGDVNRLELIANLPRIYAGTHLKHPKVDHFQATKIEVKTEEEVLIEAEGELLGKAAAQLRIVPDALRVLTVAS